MERIFKTLTTHQQISLTSYISEYLLSYPDVEILIGCDSQNQYSATYYAIVVGLYNPGKGAHVLYSKWSADFEKENTVRLLNEVWYSVEVAEYIKNKLNIRATWIDIDLNPDPKYRSNQVLTSAVGIVTGMGYKVRHKGNDPVMVYAADHIVK